jgi:hypothetical protein
MEDEHGMDGAFTGPGPQDIANGTAILASALVREAQSLAARRTGCAARSTSSSTAIPPKPRTAR